MIEVELPDGSIAEFPADTSPDIMKSAISKQFATPPSPEKGFMQSAADFLSPFPSQQQAAKNLDSYKAMLAAGAQGITGGKADEMMAALSAAGSVPVTGMIEAANMVGADIQNPLAGKGIAEGMGRAYDAALEQNRAGYKEAVAGHPYAEAAGVIGGSIANPINKIIPTGGGMLATGAQGALLGADYGFSSGEGGFRERAANAIEQGVVGGALGAAGGALVTGAKYAAGKIGNKLNPAPKAQEILDKYVEVKDYAQKTGGVISPRALDVTLRVMERKAPKGQVGIARAQKEGSAVTEARDFLAQFKGKPLSFDDVEEADKYISNLITAEYTAKKGATGDAVKLKDIQETFRRMVQKDAPAGSGFKAKRDAQFLYTQKAKITDLEDIIDRASRTDNPATSVKNQLNQLLNNKKAVRSFTEKERQLIRDAVETGKGTELLRGAGSRLVPIAQFAMGDITGAATQVAISDVARKTAGAIQMEKLNRVINEISRTAEGKIRSINYLSKPIPKEAAKRMYPAMEPMREKPRYTPPAREGAMRFPERQPIPEGQKLLPAPTPSGEMAVTLSGQAMPMTGTQSAEAAARRQAIRQSGRLEALRAQEPPIQNFPDPRVPKATEFPDSPERAIIDQAYAIRNSLKDTFRGDVDKEVIKQLGFKPRSLSQLVVDHGGIRKVGELRDAGLNNRSMVGLIRNKGEQLDFLKQAAHERGYFPNAKNYDDISDSEFFDALVQDRQGKKVYSFEDQVRMDEIAQKLMPDQELERLGIRSDMTVKEIADILLEAEGSPPLKDIRPNLKTKIKNLAKDESGSVGDVTNNSLMKKQNTFRTEEGSFSVYDAEKNIRGRSPMFTVLEDKKGWVVRNAIIPDNMQKKGIASDFYKKMNNESIRKTGNPLRSSPPRKLLSGETVTELTPAAEKMWESFVRKGQAVKIGDKQYKFLKTNPDLLAARAPLAVSGAGGAAAYALSPEDAKAQPTKITIRPDRNK